MIGVSRAAEVREMDRRVIEDLGVPGVALMETASRAVAGAIAEHHAEAARRGVVVVCGGGNNGGDGYCCARWLHGWGLPVATWSLKESSGGDAGVNRAAAEALGVPEVMGLGDAGLIVDAVFGTGLSRPVEGRYATVLQAMADHPAPVVAVDLPSGLDSDTGQVLGVVVPAVRTVTFGRLKPGLLTEPGASLSGEFEVVDIGIEVSGVKPYAEVWELEDIAGLWPARDPADHKTRSGHLLLVAGSEAMAGAAVLAARGALAAGVGLLTVLAPAGALPRLGALPPEAMLWVSGDGPVIAPPDDQALQRRSAVAAGPGLGGGLGPLPEAVGVWLERLWRTAEVPVVFDADALPYAVGAGPPGRVITPHPGEAARVLSRTVREVQADRFAAAEALAAGRVALLKGRHTLVAAAGHPISVNATGNAVLATGGSGDVLTGVIGALLARGLAARDAARLGAWVHGAAADHLASIREDGWTAGDVAAALPDVVGALGATPRP